MSFNVHCTIIKYFTFVKKFRNNLVFDMTALHIKIWSAYS